MYAYLLLFAILQVSAEEMEEMQRGTWENPAFAALDDVVEERYVQFETSDLPK